MDELAGSLSSALLTPEEARAMRAPGGTDAAVLLAMYGHPGRPGLVFTERRQDLRRHPGEISFPGGRQDSPDEELVATALRESHEEIGLEPAQVELMGALAPVGTFVTGYKVHPFVGLIPDDLRFEPNPDEVAAVLLFRIEELRAGFSMRRLVRRGVPFRTPTYQVGKHMIWGATARILADLLERLEGEGGSRA
ncbi:MAG TPA: CoA pyrophosphatase [Solirubrobacterales bacterium]